MKWMLAEEGLRDASPARVAEVVTQRVFIRHGLGGMLATVYADSRFAALSDLFPELRPWQMGVCVPQAYWQGPQGRERAHAAMLWLLDQAGLRELDPVEVAQKFDKDLFKSFGLAGMLQDVYGGSLYWALADIFPGVRPWQIALPTPKSYWKDEQGRQRAREATRWVLAQLELRQGNEERAGLLPGAPHLTAADFVRLGLRGMLGCIYGDSARRALADALPYIPDMLSEEMLTAGNQ